MYKVFLLICFLSVSCSLVLYPSALLDAPTNDIQPRMLNVAVTDKPLDGLCVCYDVNEDRVIAVLKETAFSPVQVDLYDGEGAFIRGLKFPALFGTYPAIAAGWIQGNLYLYSKKSDTAYLYTEDGNPLGLVEADDASKVFNKTFLSKRVKQSKREVGDQRYLMVNTKFNVFLGYYTTILMNRNGQTSVVYGDSWKESIGSIAFIAFIVAVPTGVLIMTLVTRKRFKEKEKIPRELHGIVDAVYVGRNGITLREFIDHQERG